MRAFVFTDKALGRQAGRFVWLSINTEKRENAGVLAKYPIQASPTLFVLDPVAEKVVLKYVGAATVQLTLADGSTATLPVVEGLFLGSLDKGTKVAQVTAYDKAGNRVAQTRP